MIMERIKNFINKYGLILVFLMLSIIFYILLRTVNNGSVAVFDNVIYSFVKPYISDSMTKIAKMITELGNIYVMIPTIIIFYIFNKDKSFNKYFTINLIIVFLFNFFIKNLVQRPRPLDINLIIENGFSFPSGHSMVSCGYYGFLIYYITKLPWKRIYKILLNTFLVLLIVTIGLTRIYLGVHFASDVIAGFVVAILYLIFYIKFIYNKEKDSSK